MQIPGIDDLTPVGRGGFAVVYRGHQAAFGRDVAVKVVTGSTHDTVTRRRFERECRSLGPLSDHPNIVGVFDAGVLDTGEPYLVMEYLPGGSYQQAMEARGAIPWREACEAVAKVADALETAHQAGIVHCDVKPANVLMSRFGEPQLADFGIARLGAEGELTAGAVTPDYGAPEVFSGADPEPRRDVYALGATLAALVLGRAPFATTTPGDLVTRLDQVLTAPPPDLRRHGVPDAVSRVVETAMAKQPQDRQQSAAAFASELRGALDASPAVGTAPPTTIVSAPGPARAAVAAAYQATTVVPALSSPQPPGPPAVHRRGRAGGVIAALVGVFVVAVLGGAAMAITMSANDDSSDLGAGTETTAVSTTAVPPGSAPTVGAPVATVPVDTTTTTTELPATTSTTVRTTTPAAPTTVAPTTVATPPTSTPSVQATVVRTCGSSGNGDCFVSLRSIPAPDPPELGKLNEGSTVAVVCQVHGASATSSVLGASSTVWARTPDGKYLANIFLDAPTLDPFTITMPTCP